MDKTLNERELADRWSMSQKTLQSWRSKNRGPEYFKLGRRVQYSLVAVIAYENQARTNVGFFGVDEILLYLEQVGQASLEQIRAACLGGKISRLQMQYRLSRLTRCTPPKVKATMLALDPSSPVMTVIYSLCNDDEQ